MPRCRAAGWHSRLTLLTDAAEILHTCQPHATGSPLGLQTSSAPLCNIRMPKAPAAGPCRRLIRQIPSEGCSPAPHLPAMTLSGRLMWQAHASDSCHMLMRQNSGWGCSTVPRPYATSTRSKFMRQDFSAGCSSAGYPCAASFHGSLIWQAPRRTFAVEVASLLHNCTPYPHAASS
eukprot:gene10175-biopygen6799